MTDPLPARPVKAEFLSKIAGSPIVFCILLLLLGGAVAGCSDSHSGDDFVEFSELEQPKIPAVRPEESDSFTKADGPATAEGASQLAEPVTTSKKATADPSASETEKAAADPSASENRKSGC